MKETPKNKHVLPQKKWGQFGMPCIIIAYWFWNGVDLSIDQPTNGESYDQGKITKGWSTDNIWKPQLKHMGPQICQFPHLHSKQMILRSQTYLWRWVSHSEGGVFFQTGCGFWCHLLVTNRDFHPGKKKNKTSEQCQKPSDKSLILQTMDCDN